MCALRIEDLDLGPDATNDEDKALAIAFKDGDRRAYDVIYSRHIERVRGICRRMLRQPEDVQEATQETFLRIYRSLPKFNGRYQLGAWIVRIATNVCLDQLRSAGRRPTDPLPGEELEMLDDAVPATDPEVVCIRNAESRRIRRVLESLPPMHRAAIILRDIEGLSYFEVAAALEITEVQVKALIHRARKNFQRTWSASLVSVLLPWRLIAKLRTVDPAAREHAATTVSSSSNIVFQCNLALAQCGQFVIERVGAVTAVVVAPALIAGGASVAAPKLTVPAAPAITVAAVEHDTASVPEKKAKRAPRKATAAAPVAETAEDAPPGSQPPAEEPQPEPTPTGPPGNSSGGVNGNPPPQPSPSPPPAEPQSFSLAFGISGIDATDACTECVLPTNVKSETGSDDESGLTSFNQVVDGGITVDGTAVYGVSAAHSSSDMAAHSVSFRVWTSEGSFDLSGSGALASSGKTAWGGHRYTFTGTFTRGSGSSRHTSLPASGSYSVTIDFSTTQHRILSTSISLY